MINTPKAIVISTVIIAAALVFMMRYQAVSVGNEKGFFLLDRWSGDIEVIFASIRRDVAKEETNRFNKYDQQPEN